MARELSRWGPSHDCFFDGCRVSRSVNFFRLSDGSLCTSVTVPAGAEQSGRSGEQMLTHFLVGDATAMGEFACDPFALVRAADALGVFDIHEASDAPMNTITLAGRSRTLDERLLERATENVGTEALTSLLSACIRDTFVALAGSNDAETDIQALIQVLPIDCRAELSFSTALRHSPRRPFRLLVAPDDYVEQRRLERTFDTTIVDLSASAESLDAPTGEWPRFVLQCLAAKSWDELTSAVSKGGAPQTLRDLSRSMAAQPRQANRDEPNVAVATASVARADAPHARHAVDHADMPGHLIGAQHGELMDRLGQLDDVVFDAVSGDHSAVEKLRSLWPAFCRDLEPSLVDESKEQYLRYVVQRWKDTSRLDTPTTPDATALLDIVSLLFEPS